MRKRNYKRPERYGFIMADYRKKYDEEYGAHGPSQSSDCGDTPVSYDACTCGCWVCRSIEWGLGDNAIGHNPII